MRCHFDFIRELRLGYRNSVGRALFFTLRDRSASVRFPLVSFHARVFTTRTRAARSLLTSFPRASARGRALICVHDGAALAEFRREQPAALMNKLLLSVLFIFETGIVCAQQPTTSPAGSVTPNEVKELREQVQSLTGIVKTLQQQLKDQQVVIDKLNPASPPLPQNPEPSATPTANAAAASPAPQLIPTEDASVVASAPPPAVNANGAATTTAFPTTDASVTTTPEVTTAGPSLTAPITIAGGGGKIT